MTEPCDRTELLADDSKPQEPAEKSEIEKLLGQIQTLAKQVQQLLDLQQLY